MDFSFDPNHAEKYGVNEAIVIRVIAGWIHKNRTDRRNFHDERTWTYNTIAGWQEHFPFWSVDQMRRIIESLKAKKVLVTGNYNKTPMDRTVWYAFFDESIFLPRKIHSAKSQNGIGNNPETIPEEQPEQPNPEEKRQKNKFNQDSQPLILSTLLMTEHRKHDPKFLVGKETATLQRWAVDIDKLIRIDKRTPEEISRVILWCQSENCFWVPNILSGSKLRERFATLLSQEARERRPNTTPFPSYDSAFQRDPLEGQLHLKGYP